MSRWFISTRGTWPGRAELLENEQAYIWHDCWPIRATYVRQLDPSERVILLNPKEPWWTEIDTLDPDLRLPEGI